MPTDVTQDDNLAGNDQAASLGQTDAQLWQQRYNGLNGKLLTTQTQLAEARSGLLDERVKWEADRQAIVDQFTQTQAQLALAQEQLNEVMGKFSTVSATAETLAAQAARQRVMLQHPHLISDPIMKLVENSTLTADDLAATLGAMAQGQQQLVKQVYQEAQSGATPVVNPAAVSGSAKQEQAQASWQLALDAMSKGDMATYRAEYAKYLAYADQTGLSTMKAPVVLQSKPI
jgi:phage-related minor tail protein